MRNVEFYLKEATVITPFSCSRLQQDCPNQRQTWKDQTASTSSAPSTAENIRTSFQLISRRVSLDGKFLKFTSLAWPELRSLSKQTSVSSMYVGVAKAKLLVINRQLSWCFLSLLYFLNVTSAFVTNVMSFIEAFARLIICLFRYERCRNLTKLVLFQCNLNIAVGNNSLRGPYLLPANSSFPLRLSETQRGFDSSQIFQNS